MLWREGVPADATRSAQNAVKQIHSARRESRSRKGKLSIYLSIYLSLSIFIYRYLPPVYWWMRPPLLFVCLYICAMGCNTNTLGTPGIAEQEGTDIYLSIYLSLYIVICLLYTDGCVRLSSLSGYRCAQWAARQIHSALRKSQSKKGKYIYPYPYLYLSSTRWLTRFPILSFWVQICAMGWKTNTFGTPGIA